jgi:hypothetical protein
MRTRPKVPVPTVVDSDSSFSEKASLSRRWKV